MEKSISNIKKKISISLITKIIILFAIFLRFWKLWSVPAGYNIDEIGSAYDAWSLLHSGVDRWGISFPVYFLNYGSGQNALATYMMMLSEAIFGFNTFAIRFPAFISSLLVIFAGEGIIRLVWKNYYQIKSEIPKLLFAILYLISPICHMTARQGLESLLMFGFSTLFLYTIILAVEKEDCKHFVLSGVCCGIMLYTYAISYLVTIIFLILTIIYLIVTKKVNIKEVIAFVVPLFILAFPLILVQYVNITGHDSIKIGLLTIPKMLGYRTKDFTFSHVAENFFLTIQSSLFYDYLDYNTIPRYFVFYPMSVPFAFVGFAVCFAKLGNSLDKKEYNNISIIIFWFIAMFSISCLLRGNGVIGVNINSNRIIGIFFPTMIFIVVGMVYCFKDISRMKWKKLLALLLSILFLVYSIKFYRYYNKYYAPEDYWNYTFSDAIDFLNENNLDEKAVVSDETYTYYLASALPSSNDFSLEGDNVISKNEKGDYICTGFTDDVLAQYPDANYIYPLNAEYNFNALYKAGYKVKEFKYCRLFYKEN